ncbi:unnamed protein product [Miscanthus lutarioriparius]|uniref:Myb/SANT-like domain-containing protein n=1 Tax=Miscanthus lutarioriparius TaxID=422564 RepID=A0A811RI38_9POAL|nr:unnamed protein product [Miscanthus lutarioriparius]
MWRRICKLKGLSRALWDDDIKAIILDQDHYNGHLKDHPKDGEFLNTPIRFYDQMEAIFGGSMAIERFALGSNEALGVNSNTIDSAAGKMVDTFVGQQVDEKAEHGERSKAIELLTSNVGGNRKRSYFTEDEMLLMNNMTDVFNNLANALREIGLARVDADLYHAIMDMPRFSKEAIIVSFSHLLDNNSQGKGFVSMVDSHRVLWFRTFVAKNYYIKATCLQQ